MRKSYVKEGLVVGIICLLMMVLLPLICGEEIEFPKDQGPYTVFAVGDWEYMSLTGRHLFKLLPIVIHPYSIGNDRKLNFTMTYELIDPVIVIDGIRQTTDDPIGITFQGLRGLAIGSNALSFILINRCMGGLIIVFGRCAEIDIFPAEHIQK
jgi:hypothetical protein